MTGVVELPASLHRRVDAMLPWYVNGTLESAQLAQVEGHLAGCVRCQREVAELRGVQSACAQTGVACESQASFERLRGRLSVTPTALPSARWWARLAQAWQEASPGWRGLAAAQWLLILGLSGWLLGSPAPTAEYRTLGDRPRADLDTAGLACCQLVVVFDPQLSEARMRVLLRASGARVIDGPSEAGAYVLVLPEERVTAAQAALRAAPGVLLVQRLGASGP
jgi:anti-sigma factor RsiW